MSSSSVGLNLNPGGRFFDNTAITKRELSLVSKRRKAVKKRE
jgi:hypothetical protein